MLRQCLSELGRVLARFVPSSPWASSQRARRARYARASAGTPCWRADQHREAGRGRGRRHGLLHGLRRSRHLQPSSNDGGGPARRRAADSGSAVRLVRGSRGRHRRSSTPSSTWIGCDDPDADIDVQGQQAIISLSPTGSGRCACTFTGSHARGRRPVSAEKDACRRATPARRPAIPRSFTSLAPSSSSSVPIEPPIEPRRPGYLHDRAGLRSPGDMRRSARPTPVMTTPMIVSAS